MRLHEKLAALRKRAGLSQTDLAEQVDTTRQAVSKWETGAAAPSMENLRTLCRIYQVTMDQLTDDGQDLTEPEAAAPAEEIPAEENAPEEGSEPEAVRRDRKWHWIAAVAAALAVGIGIGRLAAPSVEAAGEAEPAVQTVQPEGVLFDLHYIASESVFHTHKLETRRGRGDTLRVYYHNDAASGCSVFLHTYGLFGGTTGAASQNVPAGSGAWFDYDGAEGKTFGVTLQSWDGGRVEGYLRVGQLS